MQDYAKLKRPDMERGGLFDTWELRAQAHRVTVIVCLLVGYTWLGWSFFSHKVFSSALWPPALMVTGCLLSMTMVRRRIRGGILMLILTLAISSLVCVGVYGLAHAPLFIIPPVLFAGVLLTPRGMMLTAAGLGLGICAVASATGAVAEFGIVELLFPLGNLAMAALASWLAGRNLFTALYWALESYENAREERDRRREQQGRLRQALHSMDEASGRLQRMNYELARARDAAEELRQFKQQLVTNVSHELRTPLALISGFSEMMYLSPESYGEPLPQVYQGDLREIYRNSQHLLSLIEDVLDLSRISAGKMLIAREMVDPRPVILEAANEIRPLIEGKGLRLEIEIPAELPQAYIDPTRVRQVLINLLNNARRFTDMGSVRLRVWARGGMLCFRVSDTGIGITQEDQGKLFDEFRQLDGTLARQHDGTGLGLKISKEFVEMHEGHIWVESEGVSGKGSTFAFELPLDELGDLKAGETVRVPGRAPVAPQRTVILVTRDDSVTPLLRRHLDGYKVVEITAWERLGEVVDQTWASAVILNPTRGSELAEMRQARELLGERDIPVILCPLAGAGQLATYLGVEAYLVKPIERQRLSVTLESLLWQGLGGDDETRSLLLVDDDPRIVRLLTRMLDSEPHSYELLRAASAGEALEVLSHRSVDAILLDIVLADVDGYTFLEMLRGEPRLADIPVVILTSLGYDLADRAYLGSPVVAVSLRGGLSNPEALGYMEGLLETYVDLAPRSGLGGMPPAAEDRSEDDGGHGSEALPES